METRYLLKKLNSPNFDYSYTFKITDKRNFGKHCSEQQNIWRRQNAYHIFQTREIFWQFDELKSTFTKRQITIGFILA